MNKVKLSQEYAALLANNDIKKYHTQDIWAYPAYPSSISNNYGWKIHISSVLTNAIEIAKKFLKLNKTKRYDFKIISSISNLEQLNMGYFGNSQVGKFITIYPEPSRVLQTLEVLYYEFHNDIGIRVGSDFPYKLSSNIYYRFGTLLEDADSIDKRDKQLKPFGNFQEIPDYSLKRYHQLPNKYLILKVLKHMGPSGVFLGLDTNRNKKVIIRYANQYYNLEECNVDETDRLLSTSAILNMGSIKHDPKYEDIIDTFYIDNSVFVVTEFVSGHTLEELILNHSLFSFQLEKRLYLFNQLLLAVNKLNKLGITFRDLSFSNVILTKDFKLKLIDFNYAIANNGLAYYAGRSLNPAGTYGFYNPKQQIKMEYPDRYGLAKFLYFLVYPDEYLKFIQKLDLNISYSEIVKAFKSSQGLVDYLPPEIKEGYESLLKGREVDQIRI